MESLADVVEAEREFREFANAQEPKWTARSMMPKGPNSFRAKKEKHIRDRWPESEYWSTPYAYRQSMKLLIDTKRSGVYDRLKSLCENHLNHSDKSMKNETATSNLVKAHDIFLKPETRLARVWKSHEVIHYTSVNFLKLN